MSAWKGLLTCLPLEGSGKQNINTHSILPPDALQWHPTVFYKHVTGGGVQSTNCFSVSEVDLARASRQLNGAKRWGSSGGVNLLLGFSNVHEEKKISKTSLVSISIEYKCGGGEGLGYHNSRRPRMPLYHWRSQLLASSQLVLRSRHPTSQK